MATMEIERKWFIDGMYLPTISSEAKFKEDHIIEQYYLVATDLHQVRVSHRHEDKGSRYTLNIKHGNGIARKEARIDITYKDFLALVGQLDDVKPIKKHIYIYTLPSGHELEISQVDDDWWYMEVEFASTQEAFAFDVKKYVNAAISDVTGDSYYAMKNYWLRTRTEGK